MYTIPKSDINYLYEMLLQNNKLQILSIDELNEIPQIHISQFCVENGFYLIPTQELVIFLSKLIKGKNTIEIGSGNGVLAEALGIKATDNKMQEQPQYRNALLASMQNPVKYGLNVEKISGNKAVKKYKPEIVIGAWITNKFNMDLFITKGIEGNQAGVKELEIIRKVDTYIHIGNLNTHVNKPINNLPHVTYTKEWLLSRSLERGQNVIQIWGKNENEI